MRLKHLMVSVRITFVALMIGAPLPAKLAYQGQAADVNRFKDLVKNCKDECRAFSDLLNDIDRDQRVTVTLTIGRNQKQVAIDSYDQPGKMTVDLADLEKFPRPTYKQSLKQWQFPSGVPNWAGTLCEQIAHILAEAYDSGKKGAAAVHEQSHKEALKAQNKVRSCYGQTDRAKDSNVVGHSLGVDAETRYGDHTETLTVKDGELVKITYKP